MTDLTQSTDPTLWYSNVPRSINRLIWIGMLLLAVCFGGFGVWSFTAPLAAAVIAQGSFVATGRNKIVQHLEGGIIDEILVAEGQTVQAGDILMTLDRTSAESNERELFIRKIRLQAMAERLLAEYHEEDKLEFSDELIAASTDTEVASILDSQKLTFEVSRKTLLNDIALLERNMEALKIRESGFAGQLEALKLRSEILKEEFETKNSLFEKGLVRKGELNTIRRVQAEADGQLARLQAEINEISHRYYTSHPMSLEQVELVWGPPVLVRKSDNGLEKRIYRLEIPSDAAFAFRFFVIRNGMVVCSGITDTVDTTSRTTAAAKDSN